MKEGFKFAVIVAAVAIFFLAVARPILFPPAVDTSVPEQSLEDEIDERMKAELAMMTPEIREKKRLEVELAREKKRLEEEEKRRLAEEERRHAEEERKRKAEQDQRDYEELVTYAKDFVAKDPRVVANVFKTWMNADAKPM